MVTGVAPEEFLTASALRCLNGQIVCPSGVAKPKDAESLGKEGVKDPSAFTIRKDLAPRQEKLFSACCGVTWEFAERSVRFFGEGGGHDLDDSYAGRPPVGAYIDSRATWRSVLI